MRELLNEVDHPGEVARLLYVFRRLNRKSVGARELIELSDRTAGSGYRYPNPTPALKFAIHLGLLSTQDNIVTITQKGELFSDRFASTPLDLSVEQGKLILGILLDDIEFRRRIERILSRFGKETASDVLQAPRILIIRSSDDQELAVFLQRLGALEYRDEVFFVRTEFDEILSLELIRVAKLDETTLWKRLEAQRLRAKAAEEFILEYEKARLTRLGRADLAELVVRISAFDVSAGYDVRSFEVNGSPRFVEVKSSVGAKVRFEWSVNERTTALQTTKLYWIYFVPLAQTLPHLAEPVIEIQDPMAEIVSGRLTETPSSFLVEASSS